MEKKFQKKMERKLYSIYPQKMQQSNWIVPENTKTSGCKRILTYRNGTTHTYVALCIKKCCVDHTFTLTHLNVTKKRLETNTLLFVYLIKASSNVPLCQLM